MPSFRLNILTRKRACSRWSRSIAALIIVAGLAACASAEDEDFQAGGGADDHPAVAAVRRLVGFIRYERDDRALQLVNMQALAQQLLGAEYSRTPPEKRARFEELLSEYIRLNAFPQARGYFKDIDISYGAPAITGGRVRIPSSIAYLGSERARFSWVLEQTAGRYQVVDFLNAQGVSSMQSSRDRQIQPLLRQGGIDLVLEKLNALVEELRNKSH